MPDIDVGRKVSEARAHLGLTQAELSARLGVARSTLAEMEMGKRRITADELYRLAELLRRPLQYFFSPLGVATLFAFRTAKEELDEPAREALVQLDNRLSEMRSLERFSGTIIRSRLHPYSVDKQANPTIAGRNVARMERARLALGSSPVPNLRDILEQRTGLLAFGYYVPASGFSGAFGCDGERAALLINVAHVRGRTNFTLAHEYAHSIIGQGDVHVELRASPDSAEERFADSFAANFLMPLDVIEEAIEYATIDPICISSDQVLMLASQFGASFEAMLGRLEHFGIVARNLGRNLRKETKPLARSRQLGLSDPRAEFPTLPMTYQQMAFLSFRNESISLSRLAEFLDLEMDEAYDRYVAWTAIMAPPKTTEAPSGTHA